jgi:hypothetical protein
MTKRICVAKKYDGTILCMPVGSGFNKDFYESRYRVVCYVNKPWSNMYILAIKNYFKDS